HLVRRKRALNLANNVFVRRHFCKRQCLRRAAQSIEVLIEPKDASVIQPQPFPDGVATLHHRIERADAGLIARQQLAVDINNDITISLVELLQHGLSLRFRGSGDKMRIARGALTMNLDAMSMQMPIQILAFVEQRQESIWKRALLRLISSK